MQLSFSKAQIAVGLSASALLMFSIAPSAQAAHWELSVEATGYASIYRNGQTEVRPANVFGNGLHREPQAAMDPLVETMPGGNALKVHAAKSQVTLNCEVTMTWTKDGMEMTLPPPPAMATFKVTLGGFTNNVFIGGAKVKSELNLGSLVQPQSIARINPDGGVQLANGRHQEQDNIFMKVNDESQSNQVGQGYRSFLIQVPTNGENKVIWTAPQMKAVIGVEEAVISSQTYTYTDRLSRLSFEAGEDYRSLTLSRDGAIGEWQTNEDGALVTHGDTLYSYNKKVLGVGTTGDLIAVPNVVQFNTAWMGRWNHTYWTDEGVLYDHPGDYTTEQWSPAEGSFHNLVPIPGHTVPQPGGGASWVSRAALPAHRQEMPLGSQYRLEIESPAYIGPWQGPATGEGEKIVTFEIKDVDGAATRAKYVLKLHDEWEKVRMTDPDAGRYRSWETLGTDLPTPEGRLSTDTGVLQITYNALPAETKMGIAALDTLVGFTTAIAGEFPGGSVGGFLVEKVYGQIDVPQEETVSKPLGSEAIWSSWQKAKDAYINPHSYNNQLPMLLGSPIEPEFILSAIPEQQALVEAALSNQNQEDDLLWRNARIIGMGRRSYVVEEAYNVDHYSKAGFLGVKSFSAFKRTSSEEVGIFKTYLPEAQDPPAAGAGIMNFSSPSEGNFLEGTPTQQVPEDSASTPLPATSGGGST